MFFELRSQSPAVRSLQQQRVQSHTAQNPIPLCGQIVEWYSSLYPRPHFSQYRRI